MLHRRRDEFGDTFARVLFPKGMYRLLRKVAADLGLLHLEESEMIEGLMGLLWETDVLTGKWCGIEGYGRADNFSNVVLHPERYYERRIRAH